MRGSQRGLFCEYVDEGHVRAGGASVRRTRSCLRALNGRQILSRLAAIGHDLALALFGAFSARDGESGDRKKNQLGGKNRVKGRRGRGEEALQGTFSPH